MPETEKRVAVAVRLLRGVRTPLTARPAPRGTINSQILEKFIDSSDMMHAEAKKETFFLSHSGPVARLTAYRGARDIVVGAGDAGSYVRCEPHSVW